MSLVTLNKSKAIDTVTENTETSNICIILFSGEGLWNHMYFCSFWVLLCL